MLLDDETAPYVVGECLVHLPREEVEEKLQQGTLLVLGICWRCSGAAVRLQLVLH
jgi:hypothetical protein